MSNTAFPRPDFAAAESFLGQLCDDAPATFQTFGEAAKKKGVAKWSRVLHGDFTEHRNTLARLNTNGAGIYIMVNQGDGSGRKADNVTAVRALFVDLDGAPLGPVMEAPLEPHIVVETSPDRWHAYWLIEGCPLDQFTPMQHALAARFNSDPAATDLPRVMRLPGFWNQKATLAEPFRARVVHESGAQPVTLDRFKAEMGVDQDAPPAPGLATDAADQAPTEIIDASQIADLRSALRHMRADDRDRWQNIGHALKTLGDTGRGLWMDWSATSDKHDPAADARTWEGFKPARTDWRHVFALAQQDGWVNPAAQVNADRPAQAAKRFEFVPVGDLVSNVQPPRWLIHGLLEAGTLAQLFGQSGSCKSFIAIDWALSIATGRDWHGAEAAQGTVVYLAGEGHGGLGRRFKAWADHHSADIKTAPLFTSKTAAALMDSSSAQSVIAAVDSIAEQHGPPGLIVVDTLARNLGPGDENSNQDVGRFIESLDQMRARYGATVLIVHHTGHMEKDRARGASCLRAAVDHEYQAAKLTDQAIKLTAHKMKEGEIPEPFYFNLQAVVVGESEDGAPITSACILPADKPAIAPKGLTPRLRRAMDTYNAAAVERGRLDGDGRFIGLHVDDWRDTFYSASTAETPEAKKKDFQRVRNELVERCELRVQDNVYSLRGLLPGDANKAIAAAIQQRIDEEATAYATASKGESDSEKLPGHQRDKAGHLSRSGQSKRDKAGHTPIGVSRVPAALQGEGGSSGTVKNVPMKRTGADLERRTDTENRSELRQRRPAA